MPATISLSTWACRHPGSERGSQLQLHQYSRCHIILSQHDSPFIPIRVSRDLCSDPNIGGRPSIAEAFKNESQGEVRPRGALCIAGPKHWRGRAGPAQDRSPEAACSVPGGAGGRGDQPVSSWTQHGRQPQLRRSRKWVSSPGRWSSGPLPTSSATTRVAGPQSGRDRPSTPGPCRDQKC